MSSRKYLLLLSLFFLPSTLRAQVTDTLYYYFPYDTAYGNECVFLGYCLDPGYCEPTATLFTPDSSVTDTSLNIFTIKTVRFSFADTFANKAFSIHIGDNYPSDTNRIHEQYFSVYSYEVNPNFPIDGIYVFKDIDVSAIPAVQNIPIDSSFWIVFHDKALWFYNTHPIPSSISGHSFLKNIPEYPGGGWVVWGCDWIVQCIIGYSHLNAINSKESKRIRQEFVLYQNAPNPFNVSTQISFRLFLNSKVELDIYNILGQKIRTLVNSYLPSGSYAMNWDGKDSSGNLVSSGVYLFSIINGNEFQSRKMILLK